MSQVETCEHGNPKESCALCKKEPETINVHHTFVGQPPQAPKKGETTDPTKDKTAEELAATKLELEQRKDELKIIALKKLEEEVTEQLSSIEDETIREQLQNHIMKSDDPLKELSDYRTNLLYQGKPIKGKKTSDGTTKVPPTGKAKAPPKAGKAGAQFQMIRDLYKIIGDDTKTEAEKDEAKRHLNIAFRQIKEGLDARPEEKGDYRLPKRTVMTCFSCGEVVNVNIEKKDCPHCGYRAGRDPTPQKPFNQPRY